MQALAPRYADRKGAVRRGRLVASTCNERVRNEESSWSARVLKADGQAQVWYSQYSGHDMGAGDGDSWQVLVGNEGEGAKRRLWGTAISLSMIG
jgi:hypothetical protein